MREQHGPSGSKKILVVDDDREILGILKRLLELKGYQVFMACDGEEALQKIGIEAPDLVILDLGLPKLSGETVCRQLRADEKTQCLPIIMLTGKCGDADKIIGKVIGANYYMTKPCNITQLSITVDSALRVDQTSLL